MIIGLGLYFLYLIVAKNFVGHFCITINDFYPFGEKYGDNVLPRGTNQYFMSTLQTNLVDCGEEFSSGYYISTNGMIGLDQQSPRDFEQGSSPCTCRYGLHVAPFLTFGSTSKYGTVQGRETNDSAILNRVNNDVITSTGYLEFNAKTAIIATWTDLTFDAYNGPVQSTPKNDFQAILTTDGQVSFAIFYYAQITWNQGDYSNNCDGDPSGVGGNCPAEIGYSAYRYNIKPTELNLSCQQESINAANKSNIFRPGVWLTRLKRADCSQRIQSPSPPYFDMLGHNSVTVSIPKTFSSTNNVECTFSYFIGARSTTKCSIISSDARGNSTVIQCTLPFLFRYGNLFGSIAISGVSKDEFYYDFTMFLTPPVPDVFVKVVNESFFDYNIWLKVSWNAELLFCPTTNSSEILVNISIITFDPDRKIFHEPEQIATEAINSGEIFIKLEQPIVGQFVSKHNLLAINRLCQGGASCQNERTLFSNMTIFDPNEYSNKFSPENQNQNKQLQTLSTVSMMGHTKLDIKYNASGLGQLVCKFYDAFSTTSVNAVPDSGWTFVTCYVPFLFSYGVINMDLTLMSSTGQNAQVLYGLNLFKKDKRSQFFNQNLISENLPISFNIDVVPSYPQIKVEQSSIERKETQLQWSPSLKLTWNPVEIPEEYPFLNAFIFSYINCYYHPKWSDGLLIDKMNIPRDAGTQNVPISQHAIDVFMNNKVIFGLGYVQADENFVLFSKMFHPNELKFKTK